MFVSVLFQGPGTVTEGLRLNCVGTLDAAGVDHVRQAGALNVELRASQIISPAIPCAVLKLVSPNCLYRTLLEYMSPVFCSCHRSQCVGECTENYG